MARPRNPDLDVRILRAVRELIAERGSSAVTVDEVSARSGVSRPSIYRRWSTRAALLFEAQTYASVAEPFPDTGSFRGDLVLALAHLVRTMEGSDREVLGAQFGQMIADAAFAERVWIHRWNPDRAAVYTLWDRAVVRGEVSPSTNGNAVIDDLVAVCLFRVFLAHRSPSAADIESIVDRVLDGVGGGASQP